MRICVKYWFVTPLAVWAPGNDLHPLKDLKLYAEGNVLIGIADIYKNLGHLWYLLEEPFAYALFDY